MSSAPEGWYVDPSTGTNLRWWSGTTWTDEVAALPTHSAPVDLFAADQSAESAVVPADAPDQQIVMLDPEIELTRLTRRELRARRGTETTPDDAPKHLPPVTAVAAVSVGSWQEPLEELEIEALPLDQHAEVSERDPGRRRRIVRLSVLLGILAVASSVAVLTAGTL